MKAVAPDLGPEPTGPAAHRHQPIQGGRDLWPAKLKSVEARAAMVRMVFQSSDRATVHMKDQMSGPEGFLPFVKAVLGGLSSYEPSESHNAFLRAGRSRPEAGAG